MNKIFPKKTNLQAYCRGKDTLADVYSLGIGAISGLMWCGVHTGDREEAQFWAARKAEIRGEDIKEAQQKTLSRMAAVFPTARPLK